MSHWDISNSKVKCNRPDIWVGSAFFSNWTSWFGPKMKMQTNWINLYSVLSWRLHQCYEVGSFNMDDIRGFTGEMVTLGRNIGTPRKFVVICESLSLIRGLHVFNMGKLCIANRRISQSWQGRCTLWEWKDILAHGKYGYIANGMLFTISKTLLCSSKDARLARSKN